MPWSTEAKTFSGHTVHNWCALGGPGGGGSGPTHKPCEPPGKAAGNGPRPPTFGFPTPKAERFRKQKGT